MGRIIMRDIYKPLEYSGGVDMGLNYLEQGVTESFAINMSPPYQRGHVWSEEQRRAFVGHVLVGGPVQPIVLNRVGRGSAGDSYEMLDGKQRITSLLMWLRGEIRADIGGGLLLHRGDIAGRFPNELMIRFNFVSLSEIEVLRYYLRLNSAGTPHSAEELERVRKLIDAAEKTER